ncbi:MAG TPA: ISNCY family transposase [Smithella sp.]|nr:ISNCY family transposase [Smithella sp.]OQC52930.1 MAG: Integrase core domain protein [Deltaproteobacteria bacterium ADurb.Bin022]HNQ64540.1 ISNCY family transposase [Smithella sp.]HOE32292.1 ISNCY family transposase [Smithella sp.]HOG09240.1 ISNCY family transposase [Smithella sp.]
MAERDMVVMSLGELKRLKLIQSAIDRQISQKQVSGILRLSERQIRRLVRAVREEGDKGIINRSRGRPSNRGLSAGTKENVIALYKEKYSDFGPTFATEKLWERDGIRLSDETLRNWLIGAGLWKKHRKRSAYRQWRPRRSCFGEMVQMDGSHHDWLEGRGPKLVLMGYIDDATNTIYAKFYDYEGTLPAMDSFKGYVKKYGLPMSVYLDRHTTYKSSRKPTEWDEASDLKFLSQFERVLKELGVEVIHALSPQAKGRVERLFGVLQDRLVKEMRLHGIKTKDEANGFLETYLPQYNEKFRVCPANETDVHVRPPRHFNWDKYLCIKDQRTIRNDHTIAYNRKLYQLEENDSKKVHIEKRRDGSLLIISKGRALKYKEITERPKQMVAVKKDLRAYNRPPKPSKDHPWKQRWKTWGTTPTVL